MSHSQAAVLLLLPLLIPTTLAFADEGAGVEYAKNSALSALFRRPNAPATVSNNKGPPPGKGAPPSDMGDGGQAPAPPGGGGRRPPCRLDSNCGPSGGQVSERDRLLRMGASSLAGLNSCLNRVLSASFDEEDSMGARDTFRSGQVSLVRCVTQYRRQLGAPPGGPGTGKPPRRETTLQRGDADEAQVVLMMLLEFFSDREGGDT